MPAYLKAGADHYNKMRRIHPRDAVSKLDYYLPTTPTSPSASSLTSTSAKKTNKTSQSSASASSGSSVARPGWQPARHRADESGQQQSQNVRKRRRGPIVGQQPKESAAIGSSAPESPFQTSGFSDGTQIVERTISEKFEPPTGLAGLQDRNFYLLESQAAAALAAHQPADLGKSHLNAVHNIGQLIRRSAVARSSDLVGKFSPGAMQHFLNHQHHPNQGPSHARLKRRNIKRFNRRMLANGSNFGQPDQQQDDEYALSELFSQSEIPGFREIFASDSYLRKFCWIVAFLVMTVLSLNDMTSLITEYLEYPITVNVRLKDSARLPFPAVTVCNLNVVRSSALCTPSSQFDLNNVMPSELREKLCAFPVDKKNNNSAGDSDMADINNIGLTTTTTASTTTSTSTSTSTTTASPSPSTTNGNGDSGSNSSTETSVASNTDRPTAEHDPSSSIQPGRGWDTNNKSATTRLPANNNNDHDHDDDDENQHSNDQSSVEGPRLPPGGASGGGAGRGRAPGRSSGPSSLGDRLNREILSTTTTSSSSLAAPTTRQTRPGGLDLGSDYRRGGARAGVVDRSRPSSSAEAASWLPPRVSRSIELGPASGEQQQQQRPFASSKSRVRIPHSQPDPRRRPNLGLINAANVMRTNQASNHVAPGGVLLQPSHGTGRLPGANPAAGLNPSGVTVNPYLNPLASNTLVPSSAAAATTSLPGSNGNGNGGTGAGFMIGNSNLGGPAQPDDFELTERQERELQESLTNWLAVMYNRDPTLTRMLGHQFDDMILRCTMKSVNCTHQRSFEHSFSPTEGNCFTYRSKIRRRPAQSAAGLSLSSSGSRWGGTSFDDAHLAGTNQGLELVLNLEKNEYISGSSQVGALVMIHHPSDLGYAASEATFVAPEFTTYIGLKMVNLTRLPWPHPEMCVDSWPGKFADTLTRNSTYSQQACLKICLQTTIQSHCQCQSATLPILELVEPPANLQPSAADLNSTNEPPAPQQQQQQRIIICDTRKQATRQCVNNVMLRAADKVHNCDCPPKCQVVRYDKTISMAKWPTKEDKVSFDRGKLDVNFQNLAKVIVYFQTMTCDEITQEGMQTPAKLFSSVGGIMGMYVGFSFLSVFEIVEVMSRKMWHHFMVRLARRSNRLARGRFSA